MTTTLKAAARETGKNVSAIRAEGLVPAVVYGAGRETVSVSVPLREFQTVHKEAGESGTVELQLPTGAVTVLIHEVTNEPVKGLPMHIDFLAIDVTKPIEVAIPIEFVGVAPAVKNGLGSLVKVMHELEVKGLSKNIPHQLEVDISVLENLDSQISVADLKLPSGVEAMVKPEDVVAAIAAVQEEKEEAAGPIDFSAIEVEKKGKKEEEGEVSE